MEPKYEFIKFKNLIPVLDKEMEMSVFIKVGDSTEYKGFYDEEFDMTQELYDSLCVVHMNTIVVEKEGKAVPVLLVYVTDSAQALLIPREISDDNK